MLMWLHEKVIAHGLFSSGILDELRIRSRFGASYSD